MPDSYVLHPNHGVVGPVAVGHVGIRGHLLLEGLVKGLVRGLVKGLMRVRVRGPAQPSESVLPLLKRPDYPLSRNL